MPGTGFSDLLHPLRIFVVQFIQTFIIRGRVVEAHQAVLKLCAPNEEVRAVRANGDGFAVGRNRRRIIFEVGLNTSQNHRPAEITRRGSDSLRVEVHKLLLALVTLCVQRGFSHQSLVLWKIVDQFDVLIDGARVVLHARKRRNQTPAQAGDLRFARLCRQR